MTDEEQRRARLVECVRASPRLMQVLTTIRALDLPQWRVFSGAVYQTVWNALVEAPPDFGIRDYDVGYFDGSDLSYEAEDAVIQRVAAAFDSPLKEMVEVRNQARVHLWFENKFGEPYSPISSTDQALIRFASPAFAVGVRLEPDDTISIAAPYGLGDLFDMRIRPNPTQPLAKGWERITTSARKRWPEVKIDLTPFGRTFGI